jgi:hypothetical protein
MAEQPLRSRQLAGIGGRGIAIIAALVLAVAAGDRSGVRWDLSADRRFTLSSALVDLLRAQTEPIELVGVWSRDDSDFTDPLTPRLREMAKENPAISYRTLDLELDKPGIDRFAHRYELSPTFGLYVCRNDRARRIAIGRSTLLTLQREIGGALIALADPNQPILFFSEGHGELRPDGGDEHGSAMLMRELRSSGFRCERFNSTVQQQVPNGVLVLAGPMGERTGANYGKAELDMLSEHLDNGGSILVLADDRIQLDLALWLRRRTILIGPTLVPISAEELLRDAAPTRAPQVLASHQHHLAGSDPATHFVLVLDRAECFDQAHPATEGAARLRQNILSPFTSEVEFIGQDEKIAAEIIRSDLMPAHGTDELMTTYPGDAWPNGRFEPLTVPENLAELGPLPIACAVEWDPKPGSSRADKGGRMIVWGSRQAACDGLIGRNAYGNSTLIAEMCSWLARRDPPPEIPPTETASYRVLVGETALFWLMAALVALIPCSALGIAMLAWWDRR